MSTNQIRKTLYKAQCMSQFFFKLFNIMDSVNDNQGFLAKVDGRFAYGRCVSLTKWNNNIYVHINDRSKCWENGQFDKTKTKSISLKWNDAVTLKDCLIQLGPYAEQMEAEQVFIFLLYL